jgi:hypothetical protein
MSAHPFALPADEVDPLVVVEEGLFERKLAVMVGYMRSGAWLLGQQQATAARSSWVCSVHGVLSLNSPVCIA